jgi:hypothetical protein
MNTQNHVHELQAGQALALSGQPDGRLVLVEGEVLVQAQASWISGMVIVPSAVRITAPASVPLSELASLRATGRAKLVIEQAPSLIATFRAALAKLQPRARGGVGRLAG